MKAMKYLTKKRKPEPVDGALVGIAKVDRRTKDLTKRIDAGDIAVINHKDIDRVAADALVERRPAAILNASKSISGRYPNLGPGIILAAGIPLIDDLGSDVMGIKEGKALRVVDGSVYQGDTLVAEGIVQS